MKYLKFILILFVFICILILYFNNTANKTLIGIVFDSFWINFLTVLFFLLIHQISGFSLPEKFYSIREFEKSGILYRTIGVKIFKFLLVKNPFPTFTAKISLKNYSTSSLFMLEKEMRNAETIHFLGFILTLIIMILFGCFRDLRFFYYMFIFNTINNLYPVFIQRYNRNRINKIVEHYSKIKDSTNDKIE